MPMTIAISDRPRGADRFGPRPVEARKHPAPRPLLARLAGAFLLVAGMATTATASASQAAASQQKVRADSTTASAARAQLQRQADSLTAAGKAAAAAAVRQRLTEGDFRPGDRILLTVTGNFAFSDTIQVRDGQVITVESLPDIPVRGVLRAELNDYMTQQLSKYVKEPVVHAQALTRLAVLGAVGRPGYYALPADILLGDAIMHAGGPAPNADVSRTIVRRGKSEILSRQQVQRAMTEGKTLDRMDLRAGDEIVVAEKKQRNVMALVYAATGLLTLGLTLYSLTR